MGIGAATHAAAMKPAWSMFRILYRHGGKLTVHTREGLFVYITLSFLFVLHAIESVGLGLASRERNAYI